MTRIFVTGSSDGVGLLCAQKLVKQGHTVVLHGRNQARASTATSACPGAAGVLVGDLSSLSETKALAEEANNSYGAFDAVIHNAGLGPRQPYKATEEGIALTFAVNTLAPYVLTCLMQRPKRLVYLSSGLHSGGDATLKDVAWKNRRWDSFKAYSDSKLHDVMLAFAVGRLWGDEVKTCAANPGWVPTKMGGAGAPDSMQAAVETQIWFTTNEQDPPSGKYYNPSKREARPQNAALDESKQDELLKICQELSGVAFPR